MAMEKYKALIEHFPLVPIKNDKHLDEAHVFAQELIMRKEPLIAEENEYLEVLLDEISKYEKKFHELRCADMTPHELLRSLMKDHHLKQVDVMTILGVSSSGVVSEIVNGQRELTKAQCVKLGHHFRLSPAAFLPKIRA